MKHLAMRFAVALVAIIAAGGCLARPTATPVPTPTSTPTPTPALVIRPVTVVAKWILTPTSTKSPTAAPLPSPPPTAMPSPAPSPSPAPTPTPAVHVVCGPLPPGLKVLFAEGFEGEHKSVIWMANVDDLSRAQIIATFPYMIPAGVTWTPGGYISPDGSKLAYLLSCTHIDDGTLGVVDIDGSDDRTLATPVLGSGTEHNVRWSCDSQWIAYLVPDPDDIGKEQAWAIRPDRSGARRLFAGGSIGFLGCAEGGWLYYSQNSDVKRMQLETQEVEMVGSVGDAGYWQLAPGCRWLALVERADRSLRIATLDGAQSYTVTQRISPDVFEHEGYRLWPVWSPDGTRVAYNPIVDSTHAEIAVTRADTGETVEVFRPAEPAYVFPNAWSPDGRFLVISINQPLGRQGDYYRALLSLDGQVQRIPTIRPDSLPPKFVGWLAE